MRNQKRPPIKCHIWILCAFVTSFSFPKLGVDLLQVLSGHFLWPGPAPGHTMCKHDTDRNKFRGKSGGVHVPATVFGFLCVFVCVLYIPALTVVQRKPPIVCVNTAGALVKSLKGGKKEEKNLLTHPRCSTNILLSCCFNDSCLANCAK